MKDFTIVGFWKFKSNRVRQEDGEWFSEKLSGGTMAFSEDGQAVLFVRSEQGPWGFSGRYRFDGNQVFITLESSTAEGLDGATLERRIQFLNNNEFKYTGGESHTDRPFETIFIRA